MNHKIQFQGSSTVYLTMKTCRSSNGKIRNMELAVVLTNDPARLRTRTVHPHKGGSAKRRPRNSNRNDRIFGE